jgi:hypothetical protein
MVMMMLVVSVVMVVVMMMMMMMMIMIMMMMMMMMMPKSVITIYGVRGQCYNNVHWRISTSIRRAPHDNTAALTS